MTSAASERKAVRTATPVAADGSVRVRLTVKDTLEQQAAERFTLAKKLRGKLEGVTATITRFERELPKAQERQQSASRQRAWYERFRWGRTTSGYLLVGGRDAGTNESLLKRYLEPTDIVFHSEDPGSPFVLVKRPSGGPAAPSPHEHGHPSPHEHGRPNGSPATGHDLLPAMPAAQDLLDAAQFTAAFSRAWRAGAAVSDVFWVQPDQVSKTPNTGEFIGRGSFIVRGEKHFLAPPVTIAVGLLPSGVAAASAPHVFASLGLTAAILAPGDTKPSDMAKRLATKLGGGPDTWLPLVPASGMRLIDWSGISRNPPTVPPRNP